MTTLNGTHNSQDPQGSRATQDGGATQDSRHLEEYKEQLFAQFGRLGRALSSPRRLELLDLLCQAERTVEDLVRHTGLSISNVSQHLAVLKSARLVTSRKDGLFVHYRLADPIVSRFWRMFRMVALQCLAEAREVVKAHGADDQSDDTLSLEELRQRVQNGDAIVLDVRPPVEFRAGHIPGALSIPLYDLPERIHEIPRDREVIAYCRGPYCLMALEATRLLQRHGLSARHVREGLLEWRDLGWTTESGHEPAADDPEAPRA